MTTGYKVTELFCIIDEFCKHFEAENVGKQLIGDDGVKRRRRKASLSDSEIITILLYFHFGSFRNFKHYYMFFIKGTLKSYFPDAVSYNRFVELESRVFFPLMFFLNLRAFGRCTGITFVDSTMIPVCHNLRRYANKVFKGIATDGKGTMGWCHGFKLHLACNDRGEIIAFVLTGANVSDKDPEVFKVLAKMKITPSAMPNDHTPAMAESSRTSWLLLTHSTPKAERMAKASAIQMGLTPR